MSLFDYFKREAKAVEAPKPEERSYTYAGPTVSTWDSWASVGSKIDSLSVVYGCINLRAQTVASLPVKVYKKVGNGHVEFTDHAYYDLISCEPNSFQTSYDFWFWAVAQLDTYGNAYIQKIRNGLGIVIELIPLNAGTILVNLDSDGVPYYVVDGKRFEDEQIIHIKGYSQNGLTGVSVIQHFKTLFDQYAELESSGTQIAKNSAKPSGVVKYPGNVKEEELNRLKAGWSNGFSGANSGKTAFLPNTFDVVPFDGGMSAQDAQYIEQKKFSAQRIACDIFRVPLHMLGLTSSPTYASVEQMAQEFITYTINPILTNIEQQLNKQLFDDESGAYVKFRTNALLRGDVKTRMEFYKMMLEHGIFTPNMVHQLEDTGLTVPPEQGGDTFIRPLNFGPATTSGSVSPAVGSFSQDPSVDSKNDNDTAPLAGVIPGLIANPAK